MIAWRGFATVAQRQSGYRFAAVNVKCLFEAYDDATPAVILASVTQRWTWPLDVLAGLPQGQLANTILNVGLIRMVDPPGGGPQVPVGPDPPPLRREGDEFLEGMTDGIELIRDLSLPRNFGP